MDEDYTDDRFAFLTNPNDMSSDDDKKSFKNRIKSKWKDLVHDNDDSSSSEEHVMTSDLGNITYMLILLVFGFGVWNIISRFMSMTEKKNNRNAQRY